MKLFGRKEIKHSEAYTDFKAQLKAVGRQRMEGYDPNLFDKITEQERSEVEKDIWNHFMNKNDADLAVLMPALKNYDGIAALKKKLAEFKIPSYGSADIALALFEATEEEKYLDIIMENYRGLAVNTPIVVGLAWLAKKPGVYDLLVDIYLHDKDEANRVQAVVGMLWRDGKLNNVKDPMELFEKIDLIRAFKLDSEEAGNQYMDTKRAKILFTELRDHLREYGGKDLKYQIKITEDAVNDLENGLTEEEKEKAVRKYYRYLWPGGRGGLSDVVLWDEDLEKRIALNEPLDRICRELKKLIDEEQRLSG